MNFDENLWSLIFFYEKKKKIAAPLRTFKIARTRNGHSYRISYTSEIGAHFSHGRRIRPDACLAAGFNDGMRRLQRVERINGILVDCRGEFESDEWSK